MTVTEAATVNAPSTRASDDTVVNVPDANLRAAINRQLDTTRAVDAAITVADMKGLTRLVVSRQDIRDLTGLEHAPNLTYLGLEDTKVSDLRPLAGLTKLHHLNLRNAPLAGNIQSLANLKKLAQLILDNTGVTDIRPLAGLTRLYINLDLSNNEITDLTPLSGLTGLSNQLNIRNTQVSDVTPLAGLPLRMLYAADSQISDVTPLARMTNLRHLALRNNEISDIAQLNVFQRLQRLQRLDIRDNPLNYHAARNIEILKGNGIPVQYTPTGNDVPIPDPLLRARINRALGNERAADAAITEAEMLSLTRLGVAARRLGPAAQQITDIRGLSYARNLTYLSLAHNNVTDLTPLSGLTKLTGMTLQRNLNLTDVSPLANLTKLTYLNLWRCQVSDISPLRSLTRLESFYARGNPISDISPLQNWPALLRTDLGANERITDLGPLVANTGLNSPGGSIYVARNGKLSYETIYTQIPALIANRVRVTFDSRVPGRPFIASGNNQTGTVGTPLASPLVVQVNDTAEPPVPFEGVPITWTVTSGGGTLQNAATKTDANGQASAGLLLGSSLGTNTVTASVSHGGLTRTLTWTATGDPMVQRQGDEQEEDPGDEEPVDVARGIYETKYGKVLPRQNTVEHWGTLKLLYEDKIKGHTATLGVRVTSLIGSIAGKSHAGAISGLLNLLNTGNAKALRAAYEDALDGLDLAHEAYLTAIDEADDAYDEYSRLAGGNPKREKEPYDPIKHWRYTCGNDQCNTPFRTDVIGYGEQNGKRWSARVAAAEAHKIGCAFLATPPCVDRDGNPTRYYALCPNGASRECPTAHNHHLLCRGGCGDLFPPYKIDLGPSLILIVPDDGAHACSRFLTKGNAWGERCGNSAHARQILLSPEERRYKRRYNCKGDAHCINYQEHGKIGDCGHIHAIKDAEEHAWVNAPAQCPETSPIFQGLIRIDKQCLREDGYFKCPYRHGNGNTGGHNYDYATGGSEEGAPPRQPPPEPVPPTPQTPAPQTPAPQTPVPETPVPETPVPETPVPETPVPETPTPQTPTPQIPDPDDEEEPPEEEDPPEAPEKEEPPPPPPPPPPPVRCGNRWTGDGRCSEGGTAAYRTEHRRTCSAGHRYWGCNRTAVKWHATTYTCTRSGCGQTYTKCSKGNGSCRARRPGGGTYQWHH